MKKSVLLCCLLVLVLLVSAPTPASAAAKTKIVIGQSIALTGPIVPQPASQEIPLIKLWLEEVKKKGGIYVPEYGKRLPVNSSDTMTRVIYRPRSTCLRNWRQWIRSTSYFHLTAPPFTGLCCR